VALAYQLTGFVTLLSFLYISAEIRSYTAALHHPTKTPLFLPANGPGRSRLPFFIVV